MKQKGKAKGFNKYQLGDYILEQLPKIGFRKPTTVQERVIPQILNRKNLIVEAATGTGKTAAYALPFLSRLNPAKNSTEFLILVPSRELAVQVEEAVNSFHGNPRIKTEALYGGAPVATDVAKLKSHPKVVIAVPGRLRDVLSSENLDWFWRDIKFLVIDEADKMLEAGFQQEFDLLLRNVRNNAQCALFSATISEDAEFLIKERFHPIMSIRLSPREAFQNIKFFGIQVEQGQSEPFLGGLIRSQKINQALIFCNKRPEVYSVSNYLRAIGFKTEAYHGLLDQEERKAILKRFANRQLDFLVATDLAARGLDIQNLPTVINFSFPQDIEIYQHRCGRTGRAGQKGTCYSLLSSNIEAIHLQSFHTEWRVALTTTQVEPLSKTQREKEKLVKMHINRGKKDKIRAGDVVGFMLNHTALSADEIGTIVSYDDYTLVDLPESATTGFEGDEVKFKIKGKTVKIRKYGLAEQKARAEKVKKRIISQKKRNKGKGK